MNRHVEEHVVITIWQDELGNSMQWDGCSFVQSHIIPTCMIGSRLRLQSRQICCEGSEWCEMISSKRATHMVVSLSLSTLLWHLFPDYRLHAELV